MTNDADPTGSLRRRLRLFTVLLAASLGCFGVAAYSGSAAEPELQLGFVRDGASAPFGVYAIDAMGLRVLPFVARLAA